MNPAKPTALKILEGNPGKRPLNLNEPKPKKAKPECPDWLEDEAKKEWFRIVPELERLGLLTVVDIAALIGYCQSWARYIEAEKYLSENDTVFVTDKGYMGQVPQVAMAQKYLKLCQSFMIQFGLTPSSRVKISVPEEDEDPMAKLFNKK
jgi:P27 family predicted phage terminase small subunit